MSDEIALTPEQPALSTDKEKFFVVGVGASAGGLEALSELLRHLPVDSGMAFVVIQHLEPNHASALTGLLSVKTAMPVVQVEADTELKPNKVFIIPPNKLLLLRNQELVLEPRPNTPERFLPIDSFFHSLAEEFRSHAIGIVLSGAASDGTLGLRDIKLNGGITFAQNQSAKFDSMPQSAIAAGVVDFVFSPRRIAEELLAIARPSVTLRAGEPGWMPEGTSLQRLLVTLRNQTGVDFAQYKQPTIIRRVNRRMTVRKVETLDQYVEIVQKEPEEVRALFDDLLINVTEFFRDAEVFEAAKRTAFSAIVRNHKPPHTIRVWVPACSSGEEVYSIAIALLEYLESEDLDWGVQIFGTDISEAAIGKARAGVYSEGAVLNVSHERLKRFFVRTESAHQISRTVREKCIFSRHNIASDPPLSRMDLISCRNLLIYFSPTLQRRVMGAFAYSLQPNGCLILGNSETLGSLSDYFQTLDEQNRIYCRKYSLPQGILEWPISSLGYEPWPKVPRAQHWDGGGAPRDFPSNSALLAPVQELPAGPPDTVVLSKFGPSGVVVNEHLQITEYRGAASTYLGGKTAMPGADLMGALHEALRAPLSSAIQEASLTNVAVVMENIAARGVSESGFAAVTVVPLASTGSGHRFLILFGRPDQDFSFDAGIPARLTSEESESLEPRELNRRLRQELEATREYLQSVIEELRSSNEEAQSANEELQSTNEEMQTSKEELQSSNEELNTVNAEMLSRNSDLAQMNDDLINLLGSMNMPIVMTGRDLRIRRFTPVAERVLRLIATDVGRPITDLKPRINIDNLETVLQRVLETLEPFEQEIQDLEGRLYLMRIRPYRTADDRIDGTVLQLLDVSELKRSLEEVKHARDYAEAIVNTVREPLVVLDQNLTIQNANRAFYDSLAVTEGAARGQTIFDVARGQFDLPSVRALFEQLNGASGQLNDVEIEHRSESGELRTFVLNAKRLTMSSQAKLVLMAFEDITERKRAAEARYRRLFESAWDGIVLVDAGTAEILDLNPFTERLFGYTRAELMGRKLWEVEPMRSVPTVRTAVDQIRDQGVLRFDNLALRSKNGQELQTEVIANVYQEGERRAIQFNIRDVTERKKFERKLQDTQKLEGLGLLAGGIAHDFNNLLTGILGNASLAYSELAPDHPARMYVRELVQAGERAAFLTRQMLAYAGKGRFIVETLDLGDLVREISALIRTSIPKRVELKLDLAPNLPQIEADPAQMQQVIMNLVINGAEAIAENATGRVEIRTSLRRVSLRESAEFFGPEHLAAEQYLQLEVSDTGSGMDDATKARIFDPFFTTKFTGRGLGLAAVLGIVNQHAGALRVYSTPGHGTTFMIMLPASEKSGISGQTEQPTSSFIPPGSTALVVDDEEVVRNLASKVLSKAGMKVLVAENGQEGMNLFRAHQGVFSVVVLDLTMPVMGGEETLIKMKELNAQVPIIVSSGFDESEASQRFGPLKPASFLQKPYTSDRLLQAVAGVLTQPANGSL